MRHFPACCSDATDSKQMYFVGGPEVLVLQFEFIESLLISYINRALVPVDFHV